MSDINISVKDWAPLQEQLLKDIGEKTKEVWAKAPQQEWLKKLTGEIAEYKYKMDQARAKGESKQAQAYQDTLDMVASQIEARVKEVEMYVKKGFMDVLKKVIVEAVRFLIRTAIPLL